MMLKVLVCQPCTVMKCYTEFLVDFVTKRQIRSFSYYCHQVRGGFVNEGRIQKAASDMLVGG